MIRYTDIEVQVTLKITVEQTGDNPPDPVKLAEEAFKEYVIDVDQTDPIYVGESNVYLSRVINPVFGTAKITRQENVED